MKPRIRMYWNEFRNQWWFYLIDRGDVVYWIGPRDTDNQPPNWTGLPFIKAAL